jgi:deoxyribodipyrimidine photo-lyase
MTFTDAELGSSETKRSVLICLLRLDLRIHDNPLFYHAHVASRPPLLDVKDHLDRIRAPDERELYSTSDYLLPVFVFDEREIELSGLPGYKREGPEARTQCFGFWKTGGFRARFISESVYDLRSRLREAGSDLLIRFGRPEDVVDNLVGAFKKDGMDVEGVWMQKEMTSQEVQVEGDIKDRLKKHNVPLEFVHAKTLIHPNDLPFEVSETPDVFTPFRKRVEALGPTMVRPCLTPPETFKPFPPSIPSTPDYRLDVSYEVDVDGLLKKAPESVEKGKDQISFHDILQGLLRPLNDTPLSFAMNITEGSSMLQQRHPASAFPLRGGESSALERLDWYFVRGKSADSSRWGKADPPPVARYKQTRNNLIGHAYSTKMSPFLAYGSISPRVIWEALNAHESKFGEDQNTYWVRFELLWRDYFFFAAEKFGNLLYDVGGFERATDPRQAERKIEDGWWKGWDAAKDGPEHVITRLLEGRTGIPFIDANILELRESGFMSNRGRQNVASFLSKDLGYDWRIGAEFFQSHLIDYDPSSNYGNWQYVAGVGNDPRASRQFNCVKQAKDYDSHGEYVKMWIPALRNLPADNVHTPWLIDVEERRRYGLKTTQMDVTMDAYPGRPVIESESWQKHYDRKEGVGSKMHGNPQEKVKDGKVKRYKKLVPPRQNAQWNNGDGRAPQGGYQGNAQSSTMAPNFLPPMYMHNASGASPTGSADHISPSTSTTPSNHAGGSRERNTSGPPRGLRGGIGAGAAIARTGSPGGLGNAFGGASTPPYSGNVRGGSSIRGGQRGFVGGALALASATGRTANVHAETGAMSKADRESSWRRGAGSTAVNDGAGTEQVSASMNNLTTSE